MKIPIRPEIETKLRACAAAEGLTLQAYLERELENLAIEGINSGDPIEPGPGFWQDKHRRLDQRARQRRPLISSW